MASMVSPIPNLFVKTSAGIRNCQRRIATCIFLTILVFAVRAIVKTVLDLVWNALAVVSICLILGYSANVRIFDHLLSDEHRLHELIKFLRPQASTDRDLQMTREGGTLNFDHPSKSTGTFVRQAMSSAPGC